MVERVKISPTLFRVNNASGDAKFSTDFRYIKTISPGSLNLAILSTSPAPLRNSTTLQNDSGHPFTASFNTRAAVNLSFFTAPFDGVVSIRPAIYARSGRSGLLSGWRANSADVGVIRVNGSDRATVRLGQATFFLPNGPNGGPLGVGACYIISSSPLTSGTSDRPTPISVSVNAGDVVSLYCAAAQTSDDAYASGSIYYRFYSTNVTLPLQVTT
jgi:hypothetical protein